MKRRWYAVLVGALVLVGLLVVGVKTPVACGSDGIGIRCNQTCDGRQTRYEVRNRVESRECEICRIIEKRQLERFQFPVGDHCAWGPWRPATGWWTLVEHCKDNGLCVPEETPEPTEEPEETPEFVPEPTSVPDPHLGLDFFPNTEEGSPPPADGRIWPVQTDNPVVGELGQAGIYVENAVCEQPVYAGQEVNGYGDGICRIIVATGRSTYVAYMYERYDMPGVQWFVPAVNDSLNGWVGFVLPDEANGDSPFNAIELDFDNAVRVR